MAEEDVLYLLGGQSEDDGHEDLGQCLHWTRRQVGLLDGEIIVYEKFKCW